MAVGWDLIEKPLPNFRKSLMDRARKREGQEVGEREWVVYGNSKLGDHYEFYEIHLPEGSRKYQCTCQGHQGGQYRSVCSHILYVILARRGQVAWTPTLIASPPEVEPEPEEEHEVEEAPLTDLDEAFPSRYPLPGWVEELRPTQHWAVEQIEHHFSRGAKVVFVDAPTGAGKSLIGELMRRKVSSDRGLYLCTTKTLQDQVARDFPYAKVVKGRSNYRTSNFPESPWITAELCDNDNEGCTYCPSVLMCPYVIARRDAQLADLGVANMAFFLSETNLGQAHFSNQPFLIIDEADLLEAELMRFIEVVISKRMMKVLGIGPPEKKTVAESWQTWITNVAYPAVTRKRHSMGSFKRLNPRDKKLYITLDRLEAKLVDISGTDLEENWVYTGYDTGQVAFKPVKVDRYAQPYLWRHGQRLLLMSATIISAEQMAEDLGLGDDEWRMVTVPSTFPPDRRPIYIDPVADVTYKNRSVAWPQIAERIASIMAWHSDERILVHTVSYQFAAYLKDQLADSRVITYTSSKHRESALTEFKNSPNGVVLAPSFDRGIDLPYDTCNVIIVAKVPYPNLGDKQVSKRLHSRGGQGWFSMMTCRTLVQMTGRAMRFDDDSCEVYILDSQFVSRVWRKNRRLLPAWWQEAVQMQGSPRERRLGA